MPLIGPLKSYIVGRIEKKRSLAKQIDGSRPEASVRLSDNVSISRIIIEPARVGQKE